LIDLFPRVSRYTDPKGNAVLPALVILHADEPLPACLPVFPSSSNGPVGLQACAHGWHPSLLDVLVSVFPVPFGKRRKGTSSGCNHRAD
jgi:hypothetical protein